MQELRRRRHEISVELRKAKKDKTLSKRRNVAIDEEPLSPLQDSNNTLANVENATPEEITAGIQSDDPERQLIATQAARKILSRDMNPPIDVLIKCGIIPRMVTFLAYNNMPKLQYEAAWALTNITSGTSEQTRVSNFHSCFLDLFLASSLEIYLPRKITP